MKPNYRLIKLRETTIGKLRRLMREMAEPGFDELITTMVRITHEYRFVFQNSGWVSPSELKALDAVNDTPDGKSL